jgi:hypothetical protein
MKPFIKDNGTIIKLREKEYFGIVKVIYILVISKTTKQMASGYISM